ncbi:hypothetical protein BH20ACI3_BH20ACI3_40500 [soil metagenome]
MKWVTRENIRVNRTATCWLVRRFVDPASEFIFVPAANVASIQAEQGAIGFDSTGAHVSPQQYARLVFLCRFGA